MDMWVSNMTDQMNGVELLIKLVLEKVKVHGDNPVAIARSVEAEIAKLPTEVRQHYECSLKMLMQLPNDYKETTKAN